MIGLNRTMQYGNLGRYKVEVMTDARFKSYYVVWKLLFHLCHCPTEMYSLNRTMQYGNFEVSIFFDALTQWFKSYYVVWKPEQYIQISKRKFQFKSYYIVWKLIWLRPPNETSPGFKSYYVVWKLQRTFLKSQQALCLNRTMQYGNWLICCIPIYSLEV